jgi:hypothetical protein
MLEPKNELALSSSEAINHLIIITDAGQLLRFSTQKGLKPNLLIFVKILNFVHQNVFELALVEFEDWATLIYE